MLAKIIDYAIWDDREKTQMLLENLYERTVNKLQSINTINISNK